MLPAPLGGVAAAALVLALVPVYLSWPFGWDQAIFAWIGDVIRDGGMPFKDAWEIRGPATYYPYALAGLLFGGGSFGVRLLDLLLALLGTGVTFLLLRQLVEPQVAFIGALCVLLNFMALGYWHTAQPDAWVGWLLVGIVWMLTREERASSITTFVVGALVAIAALMKPFYAVFLILPPAAAYLGNAPRKTIILGSITSGIGFAAVVAVGVLFFAYRGALPDLVDGYVVANWQFVAARFQHVGTWHGLKASPRRTGVLVALTVLATIGWRDTTGLIRWRLSVLGVAALFAACVIQLQHKYFDYHFQVLFPVLGAMATVGVSKSCSGVLGKRVRVLAVASAGVTALLIAAPLVKSWIAWFDYASGRVSRLEYLREFRTDLPPYSAAEAERVAQYVDLHTNPQDFVLVWGHPAVNVLARRRSPTRFVYLGPDVPRQEAIILSDLNARAPTMVLVREREIPNLTRRFPGFVGLLHARYEQVGSMGSYAVYRAVGSTS